MIGNDDFEEAACFVASELMMAWFPQKHADKEWLESQDGESWTEISLLDSQVAVNALLRWYENKYGDDLK